MHVQNAIWLKQDNYVKEATTRIVQLELKLKAVQQNCSIPCSLTTQRSHTFVDPPPEVLSMSLASLQSPTFLQGSDPLVEHRHDSCLHLIRINVNVKVTIAPLKWTLILKCSKKKCQTYPQEAKFSYIQKQQETASNKK